MPIRRRSSNRLLSSRSWTTRRTMWSAAVRSSLRSAFAPPTGSPGDAHEPRHRRLVHGLGQVGHHLLEVVGEPASVCGPRHGLHMDAAGRAGDSAELVLQVELQGSDVERAPASGWSAGVVARTTDTADSHSRKSSFPGAHAARAGQSHPREEQESRISGGIQNESFWRGSPQGQTS